MERNKPFIIVGCILTIGISLFFLVRGMLHRGPEYNPTVDRCVGERMLTETLKLIGGQGDIVVLSLAGSEFQDEMAKAQMEGFQQALKRAEGIQLLAVERPGKIEMVSRIMSVQGVPEEMFMGIIARYPSVKAVVSFLGVPRFRQEGGTINLKKLPAVVALAIPLANDWSNLVQQGVVGAVLYPELNAQAQPASSRADCSTIFAAYYRVATKETLTSSIGNP
jgi:hypothetical protein